MTVYLLTRECSNESGYLLGVYGTRQAALAAEAKAKEAALAAGEELYTGENDDTWDVDYLIEAFEVIDAEPTEADIQAALDFGKTIDQHVR